VEDTKTKISALRVGRAEPGYLAGITVENKPLAKVAQIQVRDPTTLTVALFDPAMVPKVEKELRESDLNLNPSVEGRVIIVPVPRYAYHHCH
jgi:ribosome recycling factor